MKVIEQIKQHYGMTAIIVVMTLGLSNSPVIMAKLSQLPFQAWLIILVVSSTAVVGLYLLTKLSESQSKKQQAITEQGHAIERVYQALPPENIDAHLAKAYIECRGQWELLTRKAVDITNKAPILSRERVAGFHEYVLKRMLQLARLWDGPRGVHEEGYGFQLYWTHNLNVMRHDVHEKIDTLWDHCWLGLDSTLRYQGLKQATYLLAQDGDITSPAEPDDKQRLYVANSRLFDDTITLPGAAMAFTTGKAQSIADMSDTDSLCELMGGHNDYTERRIQGFQEINAGIKSMIALPIPYNRRKAAIPTQFGVIVLTSDKTNMIGEKGMQSFINQVQPFLWLFADEPPTLASRLNKLGLEYLDENMADLY